MEVHRRHDEGDLGDQQPDEDGLQDRGHPRSLAHAIVREDAADCSLPVGVTERHFGNLLGRSIRLHVAPNPCFSNDANCADARGDDHQGHRADKPGVPW